MLVLPVEKKVDWRKPPKITLALIIINVLLFVVFSGKDNAYYQMAWKEYVDAGLHQIEVPAYEVYLERKINLDGDDRVLLLREIKESIEAKDSDWVIEYALTDLAFVEYLKEDARLFWHADQYERWETARLKINEQYIVNLSYFSFGLLPDEVGLSQLISYQFMHGGWAHLIGNMIFLFVVGFTVERALGGGRYLIAYLLCGMLSGLFYSGISQHGLQPLVGASGSISGLMGMYVAIFGLKKIRFFYFFAVYFGYFTAPALAVLPFWLLKELVDFYLDQSSGIAFMAHIGGLLSGAGLVMAFGKSWLQVKEEFHDVSEEEQDEAFRKEYDQALKLVSRMEFKSALERFKVLHKKYPQEERITLHVYHLEKLRPSGESYDQALNDIVDYSIKLSHYEQLMTIYREASEVREEIPIGQEIMTKVLYFCIRQGEMKDAEMVFAHLKRKGQDDIVREACTLMVEAFKQREQSIKVKQYQTFLNSF